MKKITLSMMICLGIMAFTGSFMAEPIVVRDSGPKECCQQKDCCPQQKGCTQKAASCGGACQQVPLCLPESFILIKTVSADYKISLPDQFYSYLRIEEFFHPPRVS